MEAQYNLNAETEARLNVEEQIRLARDTFGTKKKTSLISFNHASRPEHGRPSTTRLFFYGNGVISLNRLWLQWSSNLCSVLTKHRILKLKSSSLKHLTVCWVERSLAERMERLQIIEGNNSNFLQISWLAWYLRVVKAQHGWAGRQ